MPIDQFKLSIMENSLCLSTASERHNRPTSHEGRLIKSSRPLGLVRRPPIPRRVNTSFISDSVYAEDDRFKNSEETDLKFYDNEENMPKNGTDSEAKFRENQPGGTSRNGSPTSYQRSKTQVFENRYKLAFARSNTEEMKIKGSVKQNNSRVIYLPMFRLNMQKYSTAIDDRQTVLSARQSLKEIMANGKLRGSMPSQNMVSASFKHYQFVNPGKAMDEHEKTIVGSKRLIRSGPHKRIRHFDKDMQSSPIRIPLVPSEVEPEEPEVPHGNASSVGSTDTERMDIKMDSLDLKSVTDTINTETQRESPTLKKNSVDLRTTLKQIQNVSQNADTYKYKLSSDYQMPTLPKEDTDSVQWPSYDDIKLLRQDIRQQKCASRASQMSGITPRMITARDSDVSPSFRNTTQNKGKLDPIAVPSRAATVCPMCSIYISRGSETTPCPPNSPSVNKRRVSRISINLTSQMWHDSESEDEDFHEMFEHHHHVEPPSTEIYNKRTHQPTIIRTNQPKPAPEVLMMPKVTVKMLETKEQLQEAKMNGTKTIIY